MAGEKKSMARNEELAKIFKMAIKAEQRAQKMYRHALTQCDDEDMRGVLIGLCDDEERHEKEIAGLYKELQRFFAMEDLMEGKLHPKKSVRAEKKKNAP
jgi:rubrerythrin